MRQRLARHLDPATFETLVPAAAGPGLAAAPPLAALPPAEFNWRDRAIMLLHVGSHIEHALMVQYLFAAYSLGGPDVPATAAPSVRRWQETILGIAKEEMGHLMTVQNLLTALGGPLELGRDEFPIDTDFYPFPFALEPLSLRSLAKYVVAESPPEGWSGEVADEVRELARGDGRDVMEVGVLYGHIQALLADPDRIPADAFHTDTMPYQASWDEWGRGYGAGARGVEPGNVPDAAPTDLLLLEVYSRQSAVRALKEVGEQGEGVTPVADTGDQPSHFQRFLDIYLEMRTLSDSDLRRVSRPIPDNPTTSASAEPEDRRITDPAALLWAHLFNVRYRMLLAYLAHAFRLAGPATKSPRGLLIHRTFAEMYNLRALSGKLLSRPLVEGGDARDACAGPPFELPYTLELPARARDRARLHRDLVEASAVLIERLRPLASARDVRYLDALAESDTTAATQLARLEPAS